jgi:hypothetical protein
VKISMKRQSNMDENEENDKLKINNGTKNK